MGQELKRNYREDLTLFEGPWSRGLTALFLVALCVYVGFFADGYMIYLLTTLVLFIIAATGLNLLVGYTGQISLGHAAFLAIGAYAHVIVYTKGAPLLVSVLVGASTAGVCGFLLGIPALRLHGPYLAIVTLGFQVATDQILGRWEAVTGGRMGLGVPSPELLGLPVATVHGYFFLCLAATVLTLVGVYNLARSRIGRAFVALRDNDIAAEAMGVDLVRYKIMAFTLSAFVTGLAGALYAHLFDRLNPSNFTVFTSIELLVMVVVGGLASILGAILGATLMVMLPHMLTGFREYQSIIVGVILIAVLLFEPMGMCGRWLRIRGYFKAWPF